MGILIKLAVIVLIPFLMMTNPALEVFDSLSREFIKEDQGALESGVGFMRRITGVTFLKRQTGIDAWQVCRKSYYLGSFFALKHSSVTESGEPVIIGVGAAEKILMRERPEEGPAPLFDAVKTMEFEDCEEFKL